MTILLEILVVAAVIFGVAAFVVGRFEGMPEAPPDTGDDNLPGGRLAAHMVDRARFGLAFRGYRMSEVDGVLDRLRDELADRDDELRSLRGGTEQPETPASPEPTALRGGTEPPEPTASPELFGESVATGEPSVADGQLTLGEQ